MKRFIIALILGLAFSAVQAADVVEQRYIDQLSSGGNVSIKRAAQSIYKTGKKSTEVLDVAAEVLLSRYPTAAKDDLDALAWLCRALGNSRNSRYYSTLNEVAESDAHRKLRKYAKKALKEVGKSEGQQYIKGDVHHIASQKPDPKKAAMVAQEYINQLTLGGSVSIKRAAQSIYNTGKKSTEVLDVAAEVLLSRYPTAGKGDLDALAWLCRALGNSRNSRYYSTLNEVAESDAHGKLRKHAKKALKEVGKSEEQQYIKGTVDIAALRQAKQKAKPNKVALAKSTENASKASIEVISEGMSMREVYDLIGRPTATTTYQTGKGWNPLNFAGKDLARTVLLYKGQGKVLCSHDAFSPTSRVLEVMIDPEETGYP